MSDIRGKVWELDFLRWFGYLKNYYFLMEDKIVFKILVIVELVIIVLGVNSIDGSF